MSSGTDRSTLSVAIIAFNEERRIRACLESVKWADEIVLVDSHSTDRTREIGAEYGCRVIERDWPGYVEQVKFALAQTTKDWVLSIDADEELSPELAAEIEAVLRKKDDPHAAYEMPRHVFYLGRWIDHGGWYPDRKTRLVRRGRGSWGGEEPHYKLIVDGSVGRLNGDLYHWTYEDFSDHVRTINRFSDVVVSRYGRTYKKFRPGAILPLMVFHPVVKFLECYVWKRGFLDGRPGFIIAVSSAFYVFAKYVKAWEARLGK